MRKLTDEEMRSPTFPIPTPEQVAEFGETISAIARSLQGDKKMKVIKLKHEDGECWALPLSVVADHRAKEYAESDKTTTYKEEFDFIMEDSWEGIDWFQNNMNLSDFEHKLFQISKPDAVPFMEKFNNHDNGETKIEDYEDET